MHRDDLLPLFAWKPPVRIILFPLTKRIGKVRHTAKMLAGKQGDEATLYWRQVIAANRRHLERVGLSETDIEAELRSFFDAVQGELIRMAYAGQNTGGTA
ncbi:DUF6074 family protein [Mesorhizobium sp.]|uniref:DUF6074 family protein n=1 Tax=Mesorhizobium sp. TaxID=1871066 RepID=UPI000FE379D8|nr:DUF6074 family protein [Mesorhizobium sp.]RWK06517.1 MAG: hypothetical protein EOR42_10790 [Mesorhizobium sp.]